jgi:integrase
MVDLLNWRERMTEDMTLRDFRPRTHEGYLLATRQFIDHFGREPNSLTEEDVRVYFLHLREEKKLAPSTINIAVYALRFFFIHTLQRRWAVFNLLRVNKPRILPVVLSVPEVRTVLGAVRHPVRSMALKSIYALGLRLGEGLSLQAGQIDGDRLLVWVRDGKGAKDRGVPLPRPLLTRLRHYWRHERPASPTKYLFVAEDGSGPMHETTLQKTFTAARAEIRLEKHASIHTLRHYLPSLTMSRPGMPASFWRQAREAVST